MQNEINQTIQDEPYPYISIITVSHNSEKTIRKTIESVLGQTYTNFEYRIVDGLSDDRTVEIAHEYEKEFQRRGIPYVVTSERDNGIYDAMNKGIADARGEVIGIINSDDWYESRALEIVAKTYSKKKFDYFYANINLVKANGNVVVKKSKPDRIATSRHWNHPTCFVTKKLYDELGLFKCEGLHDDFEFFLRVRNAGKKICIRNVVIANFRVGGASNQKSIPKAKKRVLDRYRCYRENGYSRLYMLECIGMELAKWLMT